MSPAEFLDARSYSEGKQSAAETRCHQKYARGATASGVKPTCQHYHVGD